jgi:hypothetical protein
MAYRPTGRPNGRPRKHPLPGQTPTTPSITPDNPTPQPVTPTPVTPVSKISLPTSKINVSPTKTADSEQDAQLDIAISERGDNLKRLIDTILHATPPHTRAKVCLAVEALADGVHYLDIAGAAGISTQVIQGYCRQHKVFIDLWYAAKAAGENYRRAKREQIAHKHATEGTDRPVYQGGALVGVIKEFDHRLLQFLLESDDPGKYRSQGNSVTINNQVAGMIVQKHRDAPDSELAD